MFEDLIIYASIGLFAGIFGGLLGIGGSLIIIPALVLLFGPNQHLYQAAAMICNFFVASSAVMVHRKTRILVRPVLKWLIPASAVGIIAGVAASNLDFFAGPRHYLLARVFGVFLVYVAVFNLFKFYSKSTPSQLEDASRIRTVPLLSGLCGIFTGFAAGLLGIGAGTICTPAQQLFLKMPIKRAISNSSATIASVALIGTFYKNATLSVHGISIWASLKIAIVIIPAAMVGAYIGGHFLHKLPKNLVRAVFVVVVLLAAVKLLTVKAG